MPLLTDVPPKLHCVTINSTHCTKHKQFLYIDMYDILIVVINEFQETIACYLEIYIFIETFTCKYIISEFSTHTCILYRQVLLAQPEVTTTSWCQFDVILMSLGLVGTQILAYTNYR
jgi:hypothetical protein